MLSMRVHEIGSDPYQQSHLLIDSRLLSFLTFQALKTGIVCNSAATVIAALPLDKDTSTSAWVSSQPRAPYSASTNTNSNINLTEMEGQVARFALLLCITVAASGKCTSWYSLFSAFRSYVTGFHAKTCFIEKCITLYNSPYANGFSGFWASLAHFCPPEVQRQILIWHNLVLKSYLLWCFFLHAKSGLNNQSVVRGYVPNSSFGLNDGLSLQQLRDYQR